LACVLLAPDLTGERSVIHVDIELAPTVHLENAARRPASEQRQVQLAAVERTLRAVEAASDMRESEVAQKSVSDTVALQRGERGVLRRHFRAVDYLHPAKFDRLAVNAFEANEALLGKHHPGVGVAIVGGEVRRAQSQLSL